MYEVYNAVPNAAANHLNILDYNFLVFVFYANVQYHAYNNYGGRHHAWRESYIQYVFVIIISYYHIK